MVMIPRSNVYSAAFEPLLTPSLFQIDENLVLAQFNVMKTLPAYSIISDALASGEVKSNSSVIDTSSGNFALGLALVCKHFALKLCVISDPAIDERLKSRLMDLGAHVDIVKDPDSSGGYQRPRLALLEQYIAREPGLFWARQYYNVNNPRGYQRFANFLIDEFCSELVLVGAVGSGGSTGGTIAYLRENNPSVELVAVDTFNSVLFGLPDGPRALRGLGNSVQPGNLNHLLYDQVHWVSAELANTATRSLNRRFGCFCGPTTGAAYLVGREISKLNPSKTIVVIGPDDGSRYIDTVYNNRWLAENMITGDPLLVDPINVGSPSEVNQNRGPWQYCRWGRRRLSSAWIAA